MEHEVTLTEANFAEEIEQFDGVALVDFWASWCPPCRAMGPVIEKIADENAENVKVKVCKLDVDANEGLSQRFGARSIPTFLIFKAGKVVSTAIGITPQMKLQEQLDLALAGAMPEVA